MVLPIAPASPAAVLQTHPSSLHTHKLAYLMILHQGPPTVLAELRSPRRISVARLQRTEISHCGGIQMSSPASPVALDLRLKSVTCRPRSASHAQALPLARPSGCVCRTGGSSSTSTCLRHGSARRATSRLDPPPRPQRSPNADPLVQHNKCKEMAMASADRHARSRMSAAVSILPGPRSGGPAPAVVQRFARKRCKSRGAKS